MRKRNKTSRGSRSGRGNSRGSSASSKNVTESSVSNPSTTVGMIVPRNGLNGINSCYIRSPSTRGRRGGSAVAFPNASSIHNRSSFTASSSSSAPLRSSLELDVTLRGVVGAGLSRNFALANDNCPSSNNSNSKTIPVSSDYYLHKKFKKLTTTLSTEKDEEGPNQSQATPVMNESSGASGNSASVSASASGSDIVNVTTGLNLNDHTSKNSLSPLNHIPSSSNEDSKNGNILSLSLYSNSVPQQTNCASSSSSSQSNHNHYHPSTSTSTTTTTTSASPSELLLPINLTNCNSVEDRKCEAVNLLSHGVSSNTPTTSASGSSNNNNNSSSSSTVVYKPKFRIAPDATETTPPTKSSSSSSSSISSSDELSLSVPDSSSSLPLSLSLSSSTESSLPGPGRIGREVRMDRQSLDDRISKIIDNNQSILSHWPEHLTKRLKSHVQKRQQQQQQQIMQLQQSNSSSSSPSILQINQNQNQRNLSGGCNSDINNTMVMMSSGGSIGTESQILGSSGGSSSNHSIVVPNNFSSHPGLNLKQSISSLSSPLLTAAIPLSPALLRSHSDGIVTGGLNHHINIAEQSKKLFGDNFSEYAFASSGSNVVVGSGHNNSCSGGGSGNNSNSNDGNGCTMVPKKRRRLSPTPNRLCGGEVSELPSHEASKPSLVSGRNHSGYFQDVDMTVRMSNCGTSGAKVTIRTNSSSSANSSGSNNSNSGPSPFSYNRLMDVPSSPLKLQSVSSLSSSSPPNIQQSSSLLMRAAAGPAYFEHKSLPDTTHCLKLASPAGPGPDAGPIDLKVVGGSVSIGRLPKKGRLHIEPLRIPGPEPSPKLSVIVSPSPSILESPRVTKLSLESPLPLPLSLKRSPTMGTTAISLSALPSDFPNNASDLTAASRIKNEPVTPGSFSTISVQENNFQTPSPTPKAVTSSSSPTLSPKPLVLQTTAPNPKRPNFLALKPMNALPKASVPGALPSPETPRGAKSYNQMYINGHAYTSLVFKVSTRSSYTCLFKPQPMFLPQESDPKLSMYSNWQPRPRNKNQEDTCSPQNDSRVNDRKSPCNFIFTSAGKEKGETETVNSPDQHTSRWALIDPSYTPSPTPTPTPTSTTPTPSTSMTGNSNECTTSPPASSSRQSELSISNNNSQSPSPLMISVANTGSGKNTTLPLPNTTSPLSIQSPGTLPSRIDYNNGYNSNLQRPLDLFTGNASASMKDKFPASSFHEDKKSKSNIGSDSPGESPCSSADESNMSFSGRFSKGNTNSNGCHNARLRLQADRTVQERMSNGLYPDQDGPLSLTVNNCGSISNNSNNSHRDYLGESLHSNDDDGDDDQHSVGIIDGRFENPRVRIMEGGFESNEDYTYVRGRGRGRYVCEACGIRCKKPSMLRKHLKTHTDLRPYTCKLCNFSFKTKGNLTKHQKSKSHHKKCIGLGIHPNSSRSLAMIGPSFSDTNTDDSEDEDDPGIYNGADTDSQEDIDTEELSSSAEPDQMTRESSHSVENEIAQSLLDLSRTNRIPREIGAAGPDDLSRPLGLDSPLKPIQNQRLIQHARCNGYSPKNLGIDENSCSQASIGSSTAPEVPIDLSCRSKTISTSSTNDMDDEMESSDFKRLKLEKTSFIRSFGVVGEAQRWEPEEEFLITGCLNLKKIPNESNSTSEDKSGSNVGTPTDKSLILADVKPEIRSLNLYSNNNVGEKPFDLKLETKRKRESSTSSSCGGENYLMAPLPQSPVMQLQSSSLPPSGVPPPLVHGLPPSQSNSSGPSSQNCSTLSSKQQKLHQPWLSPRESRAPENAEGARPPVAPVETQISPSLNGELVENKVIGTLDKPREPARPALTSDHSGQNKLGHAPVTSIPNTTAFSTLVGLKPQAEFRQPSGPQALVKDEGKAECNVCGKTFARASQLNLHMNIHYLERPFRCDPCGVSFRTKGHLIKHRRSSSHDCKVKVYLTESWGVANEENPRPFKCPDCKIAFRIHGHLAKHLRSKMHIMRMECLGKLPFGIYFEMEKSGLNLTEIDTSDCDMSLISLQGVAKKIYGDSWTDRLSAPIEESV